MWSDFSLKNTLNVRNNNNNNNSHQSYPSITTVIHSYEYSTTVDNSTIETYRNRGLGKNTGHG